MILSDANLLLYAYDKSSSSHARSRRWLEAALSGDEPVGLAWITLLAFLRISTNPRAVAILWAYLVPGAGGFFLSGRES